MTIGSEMSGGVRNVTYRNIFYNAAASSATALPGGPPKPGFFPGGAHFKSQRGRGGFIENILYENIHGVGASSAISFSALHGAGPPANRTATPVFRNITVRNMHLTDVHGDGFGIGVGSGRALSCAYVDTIARGAILFSSTCSFSMFTVAKLFYLFILLVLFALLLFPPG